MFFDVLTEVLIDTLKLLPFLFLTYLLMEFLEDKAQVRSVQAIQKTGKFGPLAGAVAGVFPQCGFSAAAASLYSGGIITVGTLLAIFLSTSDEMLPIFISEAVAVPSVLKILAAKAGIGALTGFLVDFILRKVIKKKPKHEKEIHDLCEQEHCGCDEEGGSIWKAALKHTLNIALFIFIISFVAALLMKMAGQEKIAAFLTNRPFTGVMLAGLIGLIPNCAASVMITELYLKGMLGAGQMMAGLLVGAGVGLLVLFRTNRRTAENLKILLTLYAAGVIWGLILESIGIVF